MAHAGGLPAEAGVSLIPQRQDDESFADFAYRMLCDELIVLDIKPGEPLNDEVNFQASRCRPDAYTRSYEAA